MLLSPEFDPQLHPIGYALSLELASDSPSVRPCEQDSPTSSTQEFDRFGWEFGSAA